MVAVLDFSNDTVKGKRKVVPVQVMKTYRVNRGITLPNLNTSAQDRGVYSASRPATLLPREVPLEPNEQFS